MRDVSQKIRRLLYIVPYVAKHPEGVPVDQLAKMLGAERDELLQDLELLSQVGPPDGDPGEYLLVSVDEVAVLILVVVLICRLRGGWSSSTQRFSSFAR